jgi:predicted nucleic acid-binding Zn ribbon protein
MPLKDFSCDACELNLTDKIVRYGENTIPCPKCGADMKPEVSSYGFALKGIGWERDGYITVEQACHNDD